MKEIHDHSKEENPAEEHDKNEIRVYKIKFEINLLASIGAYKVEDPDPKNKGKYIFKNEDVSLMALASESEEMTIFNTESFNILVQYKWEQYGQKHHIFGSLMHLFYVICIIVYVQKIYLNNMEDPV